LIDGLLLLLTFALGALLSRVSLCAVAAMQQLVVGRSASGLGRLLLATSGAAVSLLLLAGLLPGSVWLPVDAPFRAGLIAGGALLGLGAMINGGCYLGSVLYLGTGNLNFLFTLAGIAVGMRATAMLFPGSIGVTSGLRMAAGPIWIIGVCSFAVVVILLMRTRRIAGCWLVLLTGLLAGLVYARRPGWSYGGLLQALLQGRMGLMTWRDNASALLLFAGAVAGATVTGRMRWQRPAPQRSLRCAAGGLIMGTGAALVPGGNDMLLLWAIPGLTLHGGLAYAVMLATIGAGFLLAAGHGRLPEPPQSAAPQ
jgi:uncharacterized protein